MSHVVDKELFARIEKRWNKVVLDKDIDPALREILPRINTVDGIMSVWSCAGHTLQEQDKDLPEDFDPERYCTRSYIALVIREGSEHLINQLADWMGNAGLTDYRPRFMTTLELTHLRLRGVTGLDEDENIWYPVISIEVTYNPYRDPDRVTYKEIVGSLLNYLSTKHIFTFTNKTMHSTTKEI